jgi:hypothetical protein
MCFEAKELTAKVDELQHHNDVLVEALTGVMNKSMRSVYVLERFPKTDINDPTEYLAFRGSDRYWTTEFTDALNFHSKSKAGQWASHHRDYVVTEYITYLHDFTSILAMAPKPDVSKVGEFNQSQIDACQKIHNK